MFWEDQRRKLRDIIFMSPRLDHQGLVPLPLVANICYESSKNSEGWVLNICLGSRFLACFLYGELPCVIASFPHLDKVRIRVSECQMFIMGVKFTSRMMFIVNREVPLGTLFEIQREDESRGQDDIVQGTSEYGLRDLQNLLAERNNEVTIFRRSQSMNCKATDRHLL